jgi:hypothetical protein
MSKKQANPFLPIWIVLAVLVVALSYLAFGNQKPADPQALVRKVLAKNLEINSGAFKGMLKIDAENVKPKSYIEEINGSLDFTFKGKANRLQEFMPDVDYSIALNLNAGTAEEKNNASANLDFKILDRIFYFRLRNPEISGHPYDEAIKEMVKVYTDKWYSFSFDSLEQMYPEFENFLADQKTAQATMRETLKTLFAENDIFLVSEISNSALEWKLKLEPNLDLIFSPKFFTQLGDIANSMFASVQNMPAENLAKINDYFANITEEELNQMKTTVQNVMQEIDYEMALRVRKINKTISGFTLKVDLDLAKLNFSDQPSEATGKISFSLEEKINRLNKKQRIKAPKDSVDFSKIILSFLKAKMDPQFSIETEQPAEAEESENYSEEEHEEELEEL